MKIVLEGLEFRAGHGCCAIEKRVGSRFTVDAEVEADVDEAARTDDIALTVNYLELYARIREQMATPSDTLEHVAWRLCDALFAASPKVERVRVRVAKIAPPLGGKAASAAVVLERERG